MTELGTRLKEARIASGLSLDDLQTITKIQKRYLAGIEEGDYSSMPGNFYVRAFIKQYAEAVHFDPEEVFETYKNEIPITHQESLPEQLSRVKTRKTISESQSKILNTLPKVLIVLFVLGTAMLLYYFLQSHAGNQSKDAANGSNAQVSYESKNLVKPKKAEKPKKTQEPAASDKTNAPSSDSGSTATPETPKQEISVVQSAGMKTTYAVKNTDKFVVKIVSKGSTWVSIKNGQGHSYFQNMMTAGGANSSKEFDLTPDKEAVIVVGRTLDTEIYINDQKIDYAIPPSQKVRQDITLQFVPLAK